MADTPDEPHDATSRPRWRERLRAPLEQLEPRMRPVMTWVAAHRVYAVLALLACMVLVSTVTVLWLGEPSHEDQPIEMLIAQGHDALDQARFEQAVKIAELLRAQPKLRSVERYAPEYFLGVAASSRADDLVGSDKRRWRTLAARHLDAAQDHGLPEALRPQAFVLLGKNLLESGQAAAALPWLEEAIELNEPPASALHRLLAKSYAAVQPPLFQRALDEWAVYLSNPALSPREHDEALVDRADIEMRLGDYASAQASLERIAADSPVLPQQLLQLARVLIHAAESSTDTGERETLYRQAVAQLLESQRHDTLDNRTTPRALYLTGACQAALGDRDLALEAFDQVYKRFTDSAEGLAAGIQRADVLVAMERDDEAVATFRSLLLHLPPIDAYQNDWLSREQLSDHVLLDYKTLLTGHRYAAAVALAALLGPLVGESRSLQLSAEAYERWANRLAAEAARPDVDDAAMLTERSRAAHRQAAVQYLRLARLRSTTREYPDDLWKCVTCYLNGHDYRSAIPQLQEYLAIDSRTHRRDAQLRLGESLLCIDDTDAGLQTLSALIDEQPDDAAAFDARIVVSDTLLARGEVKQARELLLANLDNDVLTPASNDWRDSLLALGRLLHTAGDHPQAIARLEEFVARYPKSSQVPLARYLLADSYQASATDSIARADASKLASDRTQHEHNADQKYRQALENFDRVLADAQDYPADDELLRNTYFGRASTLAALSQYTAARDAYLGIILRYPSRPEVMSAYVALSACYRRLEQPIQARQALAQAIAVLDRLPAETDFAATTNSSRDQWKQLIDSLSTL